MEWANNTLTMYPRLQVLIFFLVISLHLAEKHSIQPIFIIELFLLNEKKQDDLSRQPTTSDILTEWQVDFH